MENKRKIEPKKTPSYLISCLLVVFALSDNPVVICKLNIILMLLPCLQSPGSCHSGAKLDTKFALST